MDCTWSVVFPDNRQLTDNEIGWGEISVPRTYGREELHVLREEALSLAAHVGGRSHTLKLPPGARAFRHWRGRTPLMASSPTQLMYHAIGYVGETAEGDAAYRVTLEIDPRGNATLRPIEVYH